MKNGAKTSTECLGRMRQRGASLGLEVKIKFLEEVTFSQEVDNEKNFQGQPGHCKQERRPSGAVGRGREHGGLELNGGLRGVGVGSWELPAWPGKTGEGCRVPITWGPVNHPMSFFRKTTRPLFYLQ